MVYGTDGPDGPDALAEALFVCGGPDMAPALPQSAVLPGAGGSDGGAATEGAGVGAGLAATGGAGAGGGRVEGVAGGILIEIAFASGLGAAAGPSSGSVSVL